MRRLCIPLFMLLLAPGRVLAAEDFFPAPEFRTGYQMPDLVTSRAFSAAWPYIDSAVLFASLAVAAWLVFKKRSRRGIFILTLFSIAYFGFFRKGCICPIGSIQNVALSAGGHGYALPITVALFFTLPLLFTLFYGRVFCSSVCPLGAIQDVVLWKPIHIPGWLEQGLGLFAYIYLGLGVLYAALNSDFIICHYDPFIGLYRLSGPAHLLLLGAGFLLASMFIGRTYCRFVCPYGAILRILSPFSRRRVTITPDECVDCRLCETACPFGAIRHPTPKQTSNRKPSGKLQLITAIIALPLLIAGFAWIGHRSAPLLSRRDYTIRLAERIWLEDHKLVEGTTDESTGWREKAVPVETLYQDARRVQHNFAIGSTLFGVWMGLVIGLKSIALIIRRQRTGYTADPGGCLACARCYLSCPVEHDRRNQNQNQDQPAEAETAAPVPVG